MGAYYPIGVLSMTIAVHTPKALLYLVRRLYAYMRVRCGWSELVVWVGTMQERPPSGRACHYGIFRSGPCLSSALQLPKP